MTDRWSLRSRLTSAENGVLVESEIASTRRAGATLPATRATIQTQFRNAAAQTQKTLERTFGESGVSERLANRRLPSSPFHRRCLVPSSNPLTVLYSRRTLLLHLFLRELSASGLKGRHKSPLLPDWTGLPRTR